jgi:4-hydroxybenzoate polyprenyltransferase
MLFYYASANVSALHLPKEKRLYHQFVPILGATTCVALLAVVLFISPSAWIIGLAGLAAGTIYYFAKQRLTSKNSTSG